MPVQKSLPIVLVCVALGTTAAVSAHGVDEPDSRPARQTVSTKPNGEIARRLRSEARSSDPRDKAPPKSDVARCAEPASEGDDYGVGLPQAGLFYRNWRGDEPTGGNKTMNRAAGCFYETGRVTEFGFSNIIEGESFSLGRGAGDFVAYSRSMWQAADGSDDGLDVWNLRTGKRTYWDPSCATVWEDCYIADIELTPKGSIAYTGCRDIACVVFVRLASDARHRVVAHVRSGRQTMLVGRKGRLFWLNVAGRLRSIPFS